MRAMKDSGIKWIGEIPEEWEVKRIKDILEKTKEGIKIGPFGSSLTNKVLDNGPYKIYGQWNIVGKNFNAGKNYISEETFQELSSYAIKSGDILISMMGTIGKCSIIPNVITKGIMDSHVIKIRLNDVFIVPTFFEYFYDKDNSDIVMTQLNLLKKGSIMDGINSSIVKNIYIVCPPLSEQQRIATYLDTKCGEIDELIGIQEKFIEELKSYKQSVITETVTKGLNPNAKMKDSGVEWIGEIPEEWNMSKIKFEFLILDYLRQPISAENRKNELGLYNYYGASGVIDKIDDYNVDDKVLLIGEDGANLVMRNLPLIYKAEGKFWVNNHAHILKPKYSDYEYMAFLLEAGNYTHYITGSAQPKLSQENVKNFIIPVPPLSEQHLIATYLDNKCSQIDSLIALKQTKIDELKSFKKSLIYEYVTGKKTVPETV